jgi:uncharacterized protein (DUF885 family)
MFRTCRLVVDTGIHALGWTKEQAIQFMAKNTAFSLDYITREVTKFTHQITILSCSADRASKNLYLTV